MLETVERATSVRSSPKRETWVVKIGSAVLTRNGIGFDESVLADCVDQICTLHDSRGVSVILVTSGAVAEGARRLGWAGRPNEIHRQQAAASVGQPGLMKAYDESFRRRGRVSAQILLTHDDFSLAERHRNASATLRTLLDHDVVPIVNENDAVSTEEIRFGDNDMLAALVAHMSDADRLVLVMDQDGIYATDPRRARDAQLIRDACVDDDALAPAAAGWHRHDKGGTAGKVRAARMFALSGGTTAIVNGRRMDYLLSLQADPSSCGTRLTPGRIRLAKHARWLAGMRRTAGSIVLREEAVASLASGDDADVRLHHVRRVDGVFRSAELVRIVAPDGTWIARGLCNYDSNELSRSVVAAQRPSDVPDPVVHRDNLVRVDL